ATTLATAIERKNAEGILAYLAQFDTLTGLPNRHLLHDRLTQVMVQAQRSAGRIACMFVDLDRFKFVNDTFGHHVGDKLLVQVAAAVLRNADIAMYRAKERGRNNYQFYLPEMNARTLQRLQMETSLRGALERKEFLLHYQPKVDLATGEISGFEALLRWQRPGHGLVGPLEFVPVLEETGLIVPVGEWVLTSACEQLRAWEAQGIAPRPIAINISARQFQNKDLEFVIARII